LTGREVEPAAAVAKALGPAVVQIETDQGLGSGFIYDKSGLILTAAHVVDGTTQVRVRLADSSRLTGKVLGADDSTDVAVVRIQGRTSLPVAALATGVKVEVGQTAVAIGSPFGLNQTVTAGIVSAIGRSVETPGGTIPMVQTDAPINPGNSGGALADRRGRVIGINDSIAGQSGGNVGVGFAVPIDIARSVADRIVAGKSLAAGFLGVEGLDAKGAHTGAQLSSVTPNSPAAQAGLRTDDVIVAIDGEKVDSMIDLAARIRSREPGQRITIRFVRGSEQRSVDLTLGSAPR
jgi:S1-C subfamily serine protease